MPVVPAGDDGNPYRQLNYTVEVDSIDIGGFRRASGLTMRVETVEYQEGGHNEHVHQLPGQVSHSNLVLEKGLTNKTVLWDWIEDVKSPSRANEDVRRNVRVKLQSGYKENQMWGWEFRNAYPVQWDGPQLSGDGAGDIVAIQSLEFAHDGFTKLDGTP